MPEKSVNWCLLITSNSCIVGAVVNWSVGMFILWPWFQAESRLCKSGTKWCEYWRFPSSNYGNKIIPGPNISLLLPLYFLELGSQIWIKNAPKLGEGHFFYPNVSKICSTCSSPYSFSLPNQIHHKTWNDKIRILGQKKFADPWFLLKLGTIDPHFFFSFKNCEMFGRVCFNFFLKSDISL